jgi:tetratricopeptide (TPR) repeat protein
VLHGIEKPGEARAAYERSIAADASYLPGSLGIVKLDAAGRRWPAVAERAGRIVRMNPVEFPEAHLYLAVAQYNLGQHESAEESARKAVELDPLHRYPKSWHLLGMLLAERGASAEAAQNLRLYLRHAPMAQDAADVQARIASLEQRR